MANLDPERQKYLDQLLKLLALAQGTNFTSEAEAARAKAEELMRKYNLTPIEGAKDRTKFDINEHIPWAKGAQWEFMIATALAKLCGCVTYYRGNFEKFILVGTIADLEALRYMIDAVNQQRIRAWLKYKKTGPDKSWSFSFSFARALEDKIAPLLVSIMMTNREKAKLWYESTHKINDPSDDWIRGKGASDAGRAAGRDASLNRGALGRAQRQIGYRRKS